MACSRAEVLIMRMGKLLKDLRTIGWPAHLQVQRDIVKLQGEMERLAEDLERSDEKHRRT